MKICIFIVAFASLQAFALENYAQTKRMDVKIEHSSIVSALEQIEAQSEFFFFYNNKVVKLDNKVSLDLKDKTINDILDAVFKDTDIAYTINDRQIILSAKETGNSLSQQQKSITGKVTDSSGAPMPGVAVVIKGTTTGVITELDGTYSLYNIPENATLVFSFLGMKPQEINVSGRNTINVQMIIEAVGINEVVVTGYSSQRKKDITGSVDVVDIQALKSIPTGAAAQALQGQASGVTIISSGAPGGRNDIFIRGVTSFGDTQPLIIVDGVQGTLNDLTINDIESMQVLKDAGAASIYGVRGSNGVIVITTKKGKAGVPTISYDSYVGIQVPLPGNVWNLLTPQENAAEILKLNPASLLYKNGIPDYTYKGPGVAGTAMAGDPAIDPAKYNFDAANPNNDYLIQKLNKSGTDWFHEIFKPATMQSHSLTASGGTDNSNYLFSLGYLNQQGTLIGTFLKRYSGRINTEFRPNKNIRIGENVYLFYKQNPGGGPGANGPISQTATTLQLIPVHDIMGNYGGSYAGVDIGNGYNPVAGQERSKVNRDNTWVVTGNVYAEIDLLKHFTARTSFGGTINNRYDYNFTPNRYESIELHNSLNSFNEDAQYNSSYTWTNTLRYSNLFGKHSVTVLVGSEAIKNSGRGVGGSSSVFFSSDPNYLILNNGTTNITNYSNAYADALFSLFSRLDYSYDDKYLLGTTVRRDGSSVFGSNKRYGIFPSSSLGWRVSKEDFMKNITFINDLKLKGSYGILGSKSNVDPANAYTLFSSGVRTSSYDINGTSNSVVPGFMQSIIGNPSTGWEQDIITNIGMEGTVLNNKLYVSVEWYKKSINGLLFPLPLTASAGNALSPTVNIGDIENKGWDFSATYHSKIKTDFQYSIGVNVTTYKNLVVKIPDPGYFDVVSAIIPGNMVRNQVGHPVGAFYGYEVVGLFRDLADVSKSPPQTDAAPGRFKYRDVNNDGAITPDDRTFFGNPNPKFTYGLNLGINYKNFDLSGIFYGSQGNDVINYMRYFTDFYGTASQSKSNVTKNAWTPQNLNATVPVLEYSTSFSTNGAFNSYYKEDGSFFKMRSLIVGYTIKPAALKKLSISKLRVYLQATNLFTITKYTGLDPELSGSLYGSRSSSSFGIDLGNYPNNQKSFLLGTSITF